MREARFSHNHCHAILRRAGAKHASFDAVEELAKAIENIAWDVSKRAVLFADDHARLKVTREDVRAAVQEFLQSAVSNND
ncbi:MAG: histone [Nitrososphaerales archaeon]